MLDDLALAHGLHATDQLSVRVSDLAEISRAMGTLRSSPPAALGGLRVESVDDLAQGSADLPPTDGLRYHLADGARVIVRPSGTEPKLKCYLEVVVPVDPEAGVDAARISAAGAARRAPRRDQGRRRHLSVGQRTSNATTNAAASNARTVTRGQYVRRSLCRPSSYSSSERSSIPRVARAAPARCWMRCSTKSG